MKYSIGLLGLMVAVALATGCEKKTVKTEAAKEQTAVAGNTISAAGLTWDTEVKDLDWDKGAAFCAGKGMRLPTKDELVAGFKSKVMELRNPKYGYWSSTIDANDPGAAWLVSFEDGSDGNVVKTINAYVRCVAK